MRWAKRIALGLMAFVVVAIATVLIVIHTDWGRSKVRAQVESIIAETFVGGGSLGKLEGSPFSELVVRDLVINGPDGMPAIIAKTARLQLSLTSLIDQRAILEQRGILPAEELVRLATKTRRAVGAGKGTKAGCHSDLSPEEIAQKLQDEKLVKLRVSPSTDGN